MITDICDKTIHPNQLRNFYKYDNKGIKNYITQREITERMNLSDTRVYRSYLFNPTNPLYRKPPRSILRLSWFVAKELLAEGWKI